jgi:hypothetical protein
MLLIILIGFMLVGWYVQSTLKRKFKKYGQEANAFGLSGKEIAEKMLADHGIMDVRVVSVPGKLTDHYNPAEKTVNLSPEVYGGRSIAAAAVAAHECGHAVQHAQAYSWLQFRSAMVPLVNVSSKAMNIIFLLMLFGFGVLSLFPLQTVFMVVVVAQAIITVFTLATLPVEYDASDRALVWLRNTGVTAGPEYDKAADALKWAGNTYLVSALAALTTLAYYVMMMMGSRD